jgi:hypothetical protein
MQANNFKVQLFAITPKDWEFEGRKGTSYTAQLLVSSGVEDETGKVVEETFVARMKVAEHLKDTPNGEYLTVLRPFADSKGNFDLTVTRFVPLNGRPAANGKAPASAAA